MMSSYFCRAMLCKRGLCRHAVYVRPSVCVSVTFVNSVKTNKNIFNIFSPSVSQAILVFPYQAAQQYSDGTPPLNGGVDYRWGRQKSRFWAYMASLRAVNVATGQVLSTQGRRTTFPQVVKLMAGSKRGSLLMAGDDNEMFMARSLNVTTTEQHLNLRSDESVAYVRYWLDVLYYWS